MLSTPVTLMLRSWCRRAGFRPVKEQKRSHPEALADLTRVEAVKVDASAAARIVTACFEGCTPTKGLANDARAAGVDEACPRRGLSWDIFEAEGREINVSTRPSASTLSSAKTSR